MNSHYVGLSNELVVLIIHGHFSLPTEGIYAIDTNPTISSLRSMLTPGCPKGAVDPRDCRCSPRILDIRIDCRQQWLKFVLMMGVHKYEAYIAVHSTVTWSCQ